jgi:hypothetical protein
MAMRQWILLGSAMLMAGSLAACNRGADERAELQKLDDGIASNDPAVRGALEDQIMVDPALTGQSNRNAATNGDRPVDGGVPVARGGGAPREAIAEARAAVGGRMMSLPRPVALERDCTDCAARGGRPATIGELAQQQAGGRCQGRLSYGLDWARRLPAAFPVYPRAALSEAAGVAGSSCNIRVVSFTSRAGLDPVLAWYYTRARRAGYSAEHAISGNDHYVGGTMGDEAYVVIARNAGGGITEVDLVVTGGR